MRTDIPLDHNNDFECILELARKNPVVMAWVQKARLSWRSGGGLVTEEQMLIGMVVTLAEQNAALEAQCLQLLREHIGVSPLQHIADELMARWRDS